MLETDSPRSQPGQAPDSAPAGSRFSPLVEKYLPFSLSFALLFPCPLHWERGVSSRGPPGKSQHHDL